MSGITDHLAFLVHPDIQSDEGERARHVRFLATRLAAGGLALTALPLYLVLIGVPSPIEAIAFLCLVAPLGAAFLLTRTGRLDIAHGLSSAALAALVTAIACVSGGVASPALPWLVAVPLESLLSGSRRAVIFASLVAILGAVAVAALHAAGALSAALAWPATLAMPIFATTAIGHAAAVALDACRNAAAWRAERLAREARDRTMLDTIDDLVTWHDRTGNVVFASHGAETMFDCPARVLHGRGLFERVHVADRPAFLKALTDAAHGEGPARLQFRVHAGGREADRRGARRQALSPASGPLLWVELRARRVDASAATLDEQGCAVVAVTRDITQTKAHEEETEAARIQAEAANISQARFIATVSHELRTPLNAIIGFSEILAGDGLGGDGHGKVDQARRHEYARIIHLSGQHLHEVVNSLLDMSKIETGNFDFVPEPFAFGDLVDGCCDLMQLKATEAGVTLVRAVDPRLPEIVGDRRAAKQILLNLLSNAVKFTPAGGRVDLRVAHEDGSLVVRVCDTGIGIAASDLPKLGNPFFQARASHSRSYDGTGLGLSVVRGLVGLHHGAIAVESAPGEGTTVTVRLPTDCRIHACPADEPVAIETRCRAQQAPFLEPEMVKKRA